MNKKIVLGLFTAILISCCATVFAYDSGELNKRLLSCTPTKNLSGSGSSTYQISGLTGSICIFRIQYSGITNKPDLICKVPYSKMREMTSSNPIIVQNIKNQYCVMSLKKF